MCKNIVDSKWVSKQKEVMQKVENGGYFVGFTSIEI